MPESGGRWSGGRPAMPKTTMPPSLYVLGLRREAYEEVLSRLVQASRSTQEAFAKDIVAALDNRSLAFLRSAADEKLRTDFLCGLPAETSAKVCSFLDLRSLARASQVSRKWRDAIGPVWKHGCRREGIAMDERDAVGCRRRLGRIRWRRRLWDRDPANCLRINSAGPQVKALDIGTLLFVPGSSLGAGGSGRGGAGRFLAALESPSTIAFHQADGGGPTFFLTLTNGPAKLTAFNATPQLAILGFEDGLVQGWDWRRHERLWEFRNPSICAVTALGWQTLGALVGEGQGGLVAVGCEDSDVHVWSLALLVGVPVFVGSFSANVSGAPGGAGAFGAVKTIRLLLKKSLSLVVEPTTGETLAMETDRLFLGAAFQGRSMGFMGRSRSFGALMVWELEASSGEYVDQILTRMSRWNVEGVKDSLVVNAAEGTFAYLTTEDFRNYDPACPAGPVTLHEFDPVSRAELTAAFRLPSTVPDESGLREWEVLGVGAERAVVCLWESQGDPALPHLPPSQLSTLLFLSRPRPQDKHQVWREWTPSGSGVSETDWTAELAVRDWKAEAPRQGIFPPPPPTFLSKVVMGGCGWLSGWDGESDAGLAFAGCAWDSLSAAWRLRTLLWTERHH